jgi:hypothetical protein
MQQGKLIDRNPMRWNELDRNTTHSGWTDRNMTTYFHDCLLAMLRQLSITPQYGQVKFKDPGGSLGGFGTRLVRPPTLVDAYCVMAIALVWVSNRSETAAVEKDTLDVVDFGPGCRKVGSGGLRVDA